MTLSDGRTLRSRTVVWAAGVEPPPLVKDMDVAKDPRGRILVDEFLRVRDRRGVYAVGDCVHVEYGGPEVPALAQAAEQEGATAGRNLAAEILGKEVEGPFRYRQLGQLIDLGYGGALVDIFGAKFAGVIGAVVGKGSISTSSVTTSTGRGCWPTGCWISCRGPTPRRCSRWPVPTTTEARTKRIGGPPCPGEDLEADARTTTGRTRTPVRPVPPAGIRCPADRE